jgi:hypothetical protein
MNTFTDIMFRDQNLCFLVVSLAIMAIAKRSWMAYKNQRSNFEGRFNSFGSRNSRND